MMCALLFCGATAALLYAPMPLFHGFKRVGSEIVGSVKIIDESLGKVYT